MHFGIKYFPLTITTFTVMYVSLSQNLYYLLNMFYCTNVTNGNSYKLAAQPEEACLFSSDFCSAWGR